MANSSREQTRRICPVAIRSRRYLIGLSILLGTLVLTAPGSFVGSLHAQDGGLVGKWEAEQRSSGGIGTTLAFDSDGSASNTPGAMVDFAYRLEEDSLVVTYTEPGSGEHSENTTHIVVRSDSMFLTEPRSGGVTRFARVDSRSDEVEPVIGTWSFMHYTGVNAFQVFTADGNMHLRVPFRTDTGRYEVVGDSLVVSLETRDPWKVHFAVDGDLLTLTEAGGQPQRFRRVPW